MKRALSASALFLVLITGLAPVASAQMMAFETDRFAFSGTVRRYTTLAAAQTSNSAFLTNTFAVENRDLALFVTENRTPLDADWPFASTVWISTAYYYTTAENTNALPKDHPDGNNLHNNYHFETRNFGDGAHLLADAHSTRVTSRSGSFGGYDGLTDTWTTFTLNVSGAQSGNNGANGLIANFAFENDLDGVPNMGTFRSYALNVTAYGLNGVESNGQITSNSSFGPDGERLGHPTGVNGKFTGIFESISGTAAEDGFYAFDFDLNMDSWAFNVGDLALNGNFGPSNFSAPIPEPSTYAFCLSGASLLVVMVRRYRSNRGQA